MATYIYALILRLFSKYILKGDRIMSESKGFGKILSVFRFGSYSDKHNTDLENGIEYGFVLVLGATSAIVVIMLMFFVLRSVMFVL